MNLVLAGSARSGTSVFYRLLASLQPVEARYEPRSLFDLIARMRGISADDFNYIWDSYFEFEVGVANLAARGMNLNKRDESSAYRFKSAGEIRRRLSRSLSTADAREELDGIVLMVKLPDIVPRIVELRDRVNFRWVWIGRNPTDTLRSILKKGWFSDAFLSSGEPPFQLMRESQVPLWLAEDQIDEFLGGSEVDRAVMYVEAMHDSRLAPPPDLMVDFDRLCKDPGGVVEAVCETFDLAVGPKTDGVIKSFRLQMHEKSESLPLTGAQREKLSELWASWTLREGFYFKRTKQ